MGKSRYTNTEVIDGNHYGTWTDPTAGNPLGPDILDGVETVDHILVAGERLDSLAYQYYGDSEYWWVIALANRIMDPFALTPGTRLRIPSNANSIVNQVTR
jgi:nucleoid-associated protein YgaU